MAGVPVLETTSCDFDETLKNYAALTPAPQHWQNTYFMPYFFLTSKSANCHLKNRKQIINEIIFAIENFRF
jgi:hypothetical protein